MPCHHNFAAWEHETLARLTTDLYNENEQLRADLRVAIDAYRALLKAQAQGDDWK